MKSLEYPNAPRPYSGIRATIRAYSGTVLLLNLFEDGFTPVAIRECFFTDFEPFFKANSI